MSSGVAVYVLQRNTQFPEGTFGILYDPLGNILCHTAELPWNSNHPNTSCIPEGIYYVKPHNSKDHPDTWEIMDVPNRDGILIHNGNIPLKDSKGCIIVGTEEGFLAGRMAVLNSMVAMNKLRNELPDSWNWIISIIDPDELLHV